MPAVARWPVHRGGTTPVTGPVRTHRDVRTKSDSLIRTLFGLRMGNDAEPGIGAKIGVFFSGSRGGGHALFLPPTGFVRRIPEKRRSLRDCPDEREVVSMRSMEHKILLINNLRLSPPCGACPRIGGGGLRRSSWKGRQPRQLCQQCSHKLQANELYSEGTDGNPLIRPLSLYQLARDPVSDLLAKKLGNS